jgi:hypothetical protein
MADRKRAVRNTVIHDWFLEGGEPELGAVGGGAGVEEVGEIVGGGVEMSVVFRREWEVGGIVGLGVEMGVLLLKEGEMA